MQADFFQGQMERLRRVYSPASLNEERVKVLWDRFRFVDNSQFQCAVTHLIGEFTTPALPSVSRFAEAVNLFRPSTSLNSSLPEQPLDNPHAKALAEKYAAEIIPMLRGIGQGLPYDKDERIDLVPTPEGGFLTESWVEKHPDDYARRVSIIRDGLKVRTSG